MSKKKKNKKPYVIKNRSLYGFTEKQIMEKAGVSRSSVQRFKGIGVGELSKETAKKIEKARRELLKQQAKELKKEAMAALQELREVKVWEDSATLGPAGEYFVNKLGLNVLDATGKSDEELMRAMGQVREFLNKKTATPKGLKEWKENVEQASKKTSGYDEDKQKFDEKEESGIDYSEIYDYNYEHFWDVYNEIKGMDKIPSKYFDNTGKFLSNQLQEDIRKAILERTANAEKVSFETLLNDVLAEARQQYFKDQEKQIKQNDKRIPGNS